MHFNLKAGTSLETGSVFTPPLDAQRNGYTRFAGAHDFFTATRALEASLRSSPNRHGR